MKLVNFLKTIFPLVVLLTACSTATFDRNPKFEQLNSFPESFHGKYTIDGYKAGEDTGFILVETKEIKMIDNKVITKIGLSDSVMLFKDKDLYLLSMKVLPMGEERWEIYPFKLKKECILFYPITYSRYKKSLEKYFVTSSNEKLSYQMNEKMFSSFIHKKLKKKYALRLEK